MPIRSKKRGWRTGWSRAARDVDRGWRLAALTVTGCRSLPPAAQETWPAMGSYAEVAVPEATRPELTRYAEAARATLRELESELSIFNKRFTPARAFADRVRVLP